MKTPRTRSKAKGDCYRAAAELVLRRPDLHLTLVHGTCVGHGAIEGIAFGHAWAEVGDVVFDFSQGRNAVVWKTLYYKAGTCRNVTLYTREEAIRMALFHKHYGPWDPETKKVAHRENKPLTQSKGVGKLREGK